MLDVFLLLSVQMLHNVSSCDYIDVLLLCAYVLSKM